MKCVMRPLVAILCTSLSFSCAAIDSPLVGGEDDDSAGESSATTYLACPPPDLFEAALCLCEDLRDVGTITVSEGPSGVGSVGVNGAADLVNQVVIDGSLFVMRGFSAVSEVLIGEDLLIDSDASWVANLDVTGDFAIGGDAQGVGMTSVGGALRVLGQERLLGPSQIAARGDYQAPGAPPCACEGDALFDIEAAVSAVAVNNDNEAAGLDDALAGVGDTQITLDTGVYYLSDGAHVGRLAFEIVGDVALYVDGSLDAVGEESFSLADGATLDLFVSGSVRTVGTLSAGNASDPQAFRLYVGAEGGVLTVGEQEYHGSIYAPEADISFVGGTTVVGSLVGRRLSGVGTLDIKYAGAVVDPPSCEEEPDGDGDGDGDGGGGGGGGGAPVE